MKAYIITDTKAFTTGLFSGDLFDSFLFVEAEFVTDVTLNINGRLNKSYYDTDEKPSEDYSTWISKKPLAYQIIKGKRLPLSFKIVFCLSDKNLNNTVASSGTGFKPDEVENFYINVTYKAGKLYLTSGLSLNVFSMDKALGEYWDNIVERFLKTHSISYEIDK